MNASKRISITTVLITVAIATPSFVSGAEGEEATHSHRTLAPKEIRAGAKLKKIEPNHLLVKFKDSVSAETEEQVLRSRKSKKAHSLTGHLRKLHKIEVPAGQETEILASLQQSEDVEYVEYNELAPGQINTNDSMVGSQWHLANISAPQAWDVNVGTNPTVVAILDSGVDTGHPDLAGRIAAGYNFVDNNTNVADVQGHGTAAAGSAVVNTNNSIGLSSACWNCRVMPVRIAFVQDGGAYAYWSTVASGMQWAVDNGAKILNISYGGLYNSSTIANAAAYVKSKGGITFGSAGNDGQYLSTNLAPDIIFVSATNGSNQKTSWSNYGPIISVSAPGESILTTTNGGGYGYWSGTSFASPLAAGVAALMWSANPSLSNTQLRSLVLQGTDDYGLGGKDDEYGYGKVNALKSVQLALAATVAPTPTPTPAPTPVPTPAPTPTVTQDSIAPTVSILSPASGATVSRSVTVTVRAADNVGVTKVSLYVDGALMATSTSAPFSLSWNTKKSSLGSHSISVKAWDAAGNSATSTSVTVNVGR